jgi:uncharacterized protein YjdB
MRFNTRKVTGAVVLVVALTGCRGISGCDTTIPITVTPRAKVLRVGESFTATAVAEECGAVRRDLTWRWRAEDTTVVRVNASSGQIVGVSVGTTRVIAETTSSTLLLFAHLTATVTP